MRRRSKAHGYEVSVRVDGKRAWRTFADREAAEEWVRQRKSAAARREVGLPDLSATLNSVWEDYQKTHPCKTNGQSWRKHIQPALGAVPVARLRREVVQRWVDGLSAKGLAPASVARVSGCLKAILGHASLRGLIQVSPAARSKLPRRRAVRESRAFTKEEVSTLLTKAPSPRLKAILTVALGTGMRKGELSAMRWSWIDWARRVIRIPASAEAGFVPKDRDVREVPLVAGVASALIEWGRRDGRLFTGRNWDRWATEVKTKTKVPFRWHLTRHTYVSDLVQAGVALKTVQEFTGHASLRMLEQYIHLAPNAIDVARALAEKTLLGGGSAVGLASGVDAEGLWDSTRSGARTSWGRTRSPTARRSQSHSS